GTAGRSRHLVETPRLEPRRVVTLLASGTEIVCALECGDRLVGRSHECDEPPWVKRLPAVTAPRIDPGAHGLEIDRSVRALWARGLSVYTVDAARLAALEPDLLVTQVQCEACAVSLRDVEEAARAGLPSRPAIVSMRPDALSDVWADMRAIAGALGV